MVDIVIGSWDCPPDGIQSNEYNGVVWCHRRGTAYSVLFAGPASLSVHHTP